MNKYTEIIDRYLGGEMNDVEKKEFEKQLQANEELKKELELQKRVVKGIERSSLKQEINKGLKKGSFKSKTGKWFIGIALAFSIGAVVMLVKNKMPQRQEASISYDLNEEGKKQWADADKYLPAQLFTIDASNDTVIETKGGLIISIPANAFQKNGNRVNGDITLEVKEALTAFDIMKAGLSTTSNGQLLETGGMFYINARQDQENISIDKSSGLYLSVPDNKPGKNMMLFEGQRTNSGEINWVNPKPLENKLNTVDITRLNFYPPNFLDTLRNMGFDIKNKKLTDSIYYSFTCQAPAVQRADTLVSSDFEENGAIALRGVPSIGSLSIWSNQNARGAEIFRQNCATCHSTTKIKLTGPGLEGVFERVPKGDWLKRFILNNEKMIKSRDVYANKIWRENNKQAMNVFEGQLSESDIDALIVFLKTTTSDAGNSNCEIAPSRIHAIWDQKFNNTILATREFEERLQVIFTTCNHNLLDLYINNLDKKMYQVDSMAMIITSGTQFYNRFNELYKRRCGSVPLGEAHMKKLQRYMEEKRELYEKAAVKTMSSLYEREHIQDMKALEEMSNHNAKEFKRVNTLFREELVMNMEEAYRQIGKPLTPAPAANYLGTTIISTGWKNLDVYVFESTQQRTTLNYTDPESGKKAVIRYEPLTINVKDAERYDRVVAYLLPNKLSSFQRMPGTKISFKENLNELIKYGSVVFGFKGGEVYCNAITNVVPGEQTVGLSKLSKKELMNYLNNNTGDLINDVKYQLFEIKETKRRTLVAKREEIRGRLWRVIFPCHVAADTDYYP